MSPDAASGPAAVPSTTVTVEGAAERRHPAERGTVHLEVRSQGADRAEVVARTTSLHRELAQEAEWLRDAGTVTRWSADRLRASDERPWAPDGARLPLVHHASAPLEVEFGEAPALADWTERVAALEGVTVTDVGWALTDATRERLVAEVRDGAVRDAVARASAYAASLGLVTVRPVAIAEPGLLGDVAAPLPSSPGHLARALAAPSDEGGLALDPEDLVVVARVHARFAAS